MKERDQDRNLRDAYLKFKQNPADSEPMLKCLQFMIESWLEERTSQQDPFWRDNLAFYKGNHYVRDRAASAAYRARLRENHTNPIIQNIVSLVTQNTPVPRVFASTIEAQDIKDAKTTEDYGKYFWRTNRVEARLQDWVKKCAIFGNAFLHPYWNPYAGGRMNLNLPDGSEHKVAYHGNTCVEADSPFRWAFRPGIEDFEDMFDAFRSVPTSRALIESIHGPVDADAPIAYNLSSNTYRQDDDIVMVHHYWHKKTHWFEEGLYACWTGKTLLKVDVFHAESEEQNKLPCVPLIYDKIPLSFYGLSVLDQTIDMQEQLNKAASMIIDARNVAYRPRILAANEHKMPAQSITDRPGEIWRYSAAGGGKPEVVVTPFNVGEMLSHKTDVRNAMMMVAGIPGPMRGEVPPAIKTALGLQLVLEQSRSMFFPFIKHFHQGVIDLQYHILGQAAQYIDEDDPRTFKVEGFYTGDKVFHGGMIPSPLDIYLEDTNPIGWTAAGRASAAMELVQSGFPLPPEKAMEMIGIKNDEAAYELKNINKYSAAREIELMNAGNAVDIGPEDDDAAHLDEHVKIPASFDTWNGLSSIARAMHQRHIDMHKQRIQMSSGAAAGNQPAASGNAPSPKAGEALMAQLQAPQPEINQLLNA